MLTGLLMAAAVTSAAMQEHVTIVATTDVHGRAMHWDYLRDEAAPWGLTRAATAIDSIRRANGNAVLLVDAGDLLQGDLFARYVATENKLPRNPLIDAFNAMRYDAFTPGNHDFDFGVAFLDTALSSAQFNVVSANIYGAERHAFREYAVVTRNGIRIGITGATTPGTAVWNRDQLAGLRTVRPMLPEISRALESMQSDGVDLKVVLLHSGLDGQSPYEDDAVGGQNMAAQIAYLMVKPDVVVVGHSHQSLRDSVINGVHFIQAEPWARSVAVADVRFRRDDMGRLTPTQILGTSVPLAGVAPDQDLVERVSDAHDMARSWGNTPLATAGAGWDAQFSRAEDTPIIDFVNHVQRQSTGAQLSATASFDPRAGFAAGIVRMRDVMGLYPFENTLDVVRITGATLKRYLERSTEYFQTYVPGRSPLNPDMPGYNFDMVSGLDYVIDLTMPVGSRVRQMVFDKKIVQPTDQFSMVVNNYRRASGVYDMLATLPVVQRGRRRVVDLLVDEVRRVGTLRTQDYFEPTWSIMPPEAGAAVRIAFGSPDPAVTERRVFRIIATTDMNGAVQPRRTAWSSGREVGGVVALDSWIDTLATRCACPAIVLDAGGALGGSLIADRTLGRLMVDAMNAMHYDAAAIGERELAWGVDTLRTRVAGSRFPWLGANLRRAGGTALPDWARDWVMFERDGARVAVIGVTTGPGHGIALAGSDRFSVEDMGGAVRRAATQSREAGADFIVVLAHAEAYCDPSACHGALIDLVNNLEPGSVDLVVGGHSTSEAAATINGIPILLPGANGLSIGVADMYATGAGRRRIESAIHTVWVDSVGADEVLEAIVGAASFDEDAVLTTLRFPATVASGNTESSIGRLVADAYRNAARAQVAIVPNDFVLGDLPAGPVTYGQAYAVQPVRHAIRRVQVSGAVLEEALEQIVRGAAPTAHIAGLRIEYDPKGRPGNRIRRVRLDGDRGLNRGDRYWLAVNDFTADGGGGYTMLTEFPSESVGVTDYEAFITYLSRLPRPVEPPRAPRVVVRQ